jgi:hypothetical protein
MGGIPSSFGSVIVEMHCIACSVDTRLGKRRILLLGWKLRFTGTPTETNTKQNHRLMVKITASPYPKVADNFYFSTFNPT